jgi:hypothetical protein
MTHESRKTYQVNKLIPTHILWKKFNVINNAGVPDCYYHLGKRGLWIEYKSASSLGRKVEVTNLQKHFLNAVNGWVIMLTPKGHGIYITETAWSTKTPTFVENTYRDVATLITTFMET